MTRADARPRFELVPLHEIEVGTSSLYVVKDLVPATGVTVVWGPTQVGKTFVVLDLVMHIAMGEPYRGRRVKAGPVVYFVAESALGFDRRLAAYKLERIPYEARPAFYRIAASMSLVEDAGELIAAVKGQLGNEAPAVVVIDTLNKTLRGSEIKDSDMGAYYQAAETVHRELGCATLIVHHTGWDSSHMRGHSLLPANVEASLAIRKDNAGNIVLKVDKLKDGPTGDEICYRLRAVEIGHDDEGDPITSCVVEPASSVPKAASQPKACIRRLSKSDSQALAELRQLEQPASFNDWRSRLGVVFASRGKSARQAISQAKKNLEKQGMITINGDYVSLTVSASDAS